MRSLLLLVLLVSHVCAAPAKRTCRILFLGPPPGAPRSLHLFDGARWQEVELAGMNFSDVYEIAGGDTTLRLLDAPAASPEEIPADAPAGEVPAAAEDIYIIATSDPSNKRVPVRMQIIDAGAKKFKQGQMMWYNLTGNAVGGQVGEHKLAMKARSREIIDPPASGNEAYDVVLSYKLPDDERFHPICQTKWLHDPRSRMMVLVHGGVGNTTPQIAGFKDFRLPADNDG